jgi:PAS domain S-box-containing protein
MMRLCAENQQLKKMVDLAPVGMALLGLDRKIVRSNPALRRMFGLRDDLGGDFYLPLPDSKREEWDKLGERLRKGETFTNVETLRKRSDGSRFYAHISGTPLFDENGKLDGLVGVIAETSVMRRRYIERYVLESLLHRSIDFICVADLKQNVLFINDVGQQLVGLAGDDVPETLDFSDLFTGQTSDILRTTILPRVLDGADLELRLELKHFAGGKPISTLCNLFSIHDPETDEPVCIACVAHLARRQHSEGKEQIPPGQAPSSDPPVGIALVDTTGRPFDCNEQFGKILGYSVEEVKQMTFASFVHPEDLPAGRSRFLELAAGRVDHYHVTKRLVGKSGAIFGARMNVNLIRNLAGHPSYCVSMIQPLTAS